MPTDAERWRRILWDVASYCGPDESLRHNPETAEGAAWYEFRAPDCGPGVARAIPIDRLTRSDVTMIQVGAPTRRRRRRWGRAVDTPPKTHRIGRLSAVTPGQVYGWCRELTAPWLEEQRRLARERALAAAEQEAFYREVGYEIGTEGKTTVYCYDRTLRPGPTGEPQLRCTIGYEWLTLSQVRQLCEWVGVPRHETPTEPAPPSRIIELPDDDGQ